jgi:GT2 family glycosyltransferase
MKKKPKGLSILIVNYKGANYLVNLFNSIEQQFRHYILLYEIIVYDNNSNDESLALLSQIKRFTPNLKYISGIENLGFAKANNYLAEEAIYENLLLLNIDTEIVSLKNTINYLNQNQTLSNEIISCRLINPNLTTQVNVFNYPGNARLIFELFLMKHPLVKILSYRKTNKVNLKSKYFSGCFFLISSTMFNKVGGFDEEFFFYHEDCDLFLRLEKIGISKIYFENDKIIHFGGGGNITENTFNNYYLGLYRLFKKHKFKSSKFLLKTIFLLGFNFRIFLSMFGLNLNYSPFASVYSHHLKTSSTNEISNMHRNTLNNLRRLF